MPIWSNHVATLTKNKHTELFAAHFRGTYDDYIGGQALLVVRTLNESTKWLRDALAQRVMGNHNLNTAPRDAGFQPSQPGQLGRWDGRTPGAAKHGLQNNPLQLLPQWNLLRACKENLYMKTRNHWWAISLKGALQFCRVLKCTCTKIYFKVRYLFR